MTHSLKGTVIAGAAVLALGAGAGGTATAQRPGGKLPKGGERVNLDPADGPS